MNYAYVQVGGFQQYGSVSTSVTGRGVLVDSDQAVLDAVPNKYAVVKVCGSFQGNSELYFVSGDLKSVGCVSVELWDSVDDKNSIKKVDPREPLSLKSVLESNKVGKLDLLQVNTDVEEVLKQLVVLSQDNTSLLPERVVSKSWSGTVPESLVGELLYDVLWNENGQLVMYRNHPKDRALLVHRWLGHNDDLGLKTWHWVTTYGEFVAKFALGIIPIVVPGFDPKLMELVAKIGWNYVNGEFDMQNFISNIGDVLGTMKTIRNRTAAGSWNQ